jgi:hypothetical protein
MHVIMNLVKMVLDNSLWIALGAYLGYRFETQIGKLIDVAENAALALYDRLKG